MKKLVLFLLLSIYSFGYDVFVSIAPEYSLLKAIGKDRVDVHILVPKGASPHTFAPKPKQMIALSHSKLYFGIGVEFEKSWLDKFKDQNPALKVVDLSKAIQKIDNNPHIWLNLENLSKMADLVAKTLIEFDPKSSEFYKINLQKYKKSLQRCKDDILKILKDKQKREFLTFHPAFLYLAKEFDLKEITIEVDGKEPSLRELLKVIKTAKKSSITTIIASPEFSDKSAQIIAKEIGGQVIKISPLNPNICNTIKLIVNSLK